VVHFSLLHGNETSVHTRSLYMHVEYLGPNHYNIYTSYMPPREVLNTWEWRQTVGQLATLTGSEAPRELHWDCTAMWMLLGNNINRTQQPPVVIYSIPVPPKSSTALSLQTTQTSFDPNYVAVGSQKWPMQDLLYTQQGHCVRHNACHTPG